MCKFYRAEGEQPHRTPVKNGSWGVLALGFGDGVAPCWSERRQDAAGQVGLQVCRFKQLQQSAAPGNIERLVVEAAQEQPDLVLAAGTNKVDQAVGARGVHIDHVLQVHHQRNAGPLPFHLLNQFDCTKEYRAVKAESGNPARLTLQQGLVIRADGFTA